MVPLVRKSLQIARLKQTGQHPKNQQTDFKRTLKIIRVDKIIPAHTASFEEDFSQLQEQVRQDKQMKAIDDFLAGKIKETHIVIDPMFKDCEFRRPGWASKFSED